MDEEEGETLSNGITWNSLNDSSEDKASLGEKDKVFFLANSSMWPELGGRLVRSH